MNASALRLSFVLSDGWLVARVDRGGLVEITRVEAKFVADDGVRGFFLDAISRVVEQWALAEASRSIRASYKGATA